MKLPFYQVDAFTDEVFKGNPAAVVLLGRQHLPEAVLACIAEENNLSETAFVSELDDGFSLRWFTPTIEVDLCGHATLASAYVLFETGAVRGSIARFQTKSGVLAVTRQGSRLNMDFPALPPEPVAIAEDLVAALGATPLEAWQARDSVLVFEREEQVRDLRPHFFRLAALEPFAVSVTAPGEKSYVDFVSRFFAPKAGIEEDPVTGSAHCSLAPLWAQKLGRNELHGLQVSKRGGEVFCILRGERVIISGYAIEYLRGEISIPNR